MLARITRSIMLVCLVGAAGGGAAYADLRLVEAAKAQQWDTVGRLLVAKVDVTTSQPDGATALHWAAYWNEPAIVEGLLESGAQVDAENDYGATPLWTACANRNSGIVRQLLLAGADANLGLRSGETVLMRCAQTGDPLAVEALVTHGAAVGATEPSRGQTALMWAAANRHAEVVRVLLGHGALVDARTATVQQLRGTGETSTTSPQGATYFDAGGFTPLLFAARHGDVETARALLEAGAALGDTSADGNSPLVLAAISGHELLARFLLAQGADPNAAGAGYSALHAAVLRSQPDLVRDLLARGANPNARLIKGTPVPRWTYQYILTAREKGATPVMLAAKYLEPEILRLLADAGADVLIPMENGTTTLMAAVGLGLSRATNRRSRLIAPELVSAEWADESLVLETIQVAVKAGAASVINEIGRAGNTVLHGAARGRFQQVAAFLVEQGADPDIPNEDGATGREMLDLLEGS
ncbi:MAG: hypothetical protein CL484_13135 [Acidobacteria bacterium]|nr:hypothetical protein [Acidobacteriota bacterium]